MSTIRLRTSRRGLAGFPRELRVVGSDDSGDVLAVDAAGKVWCCAHDVGHWQPRTLAFADEAQLHDYVQFQDELRLPGEDESPSELRARKLRIEDFVRGRRGAPFAREACAEALRDLRERLAELRWQASPRGRSLAARQELGRQCEAALRDAGAGDDWMVRAHAERRNALGVMGAFAPPWTEARVRELLQPLLGTLELVCWRRT